LDIRGELDFHAGEIQIPVMRSAVRYEALMPIDGIDMRDRYCELRWKASEFLQAEGYLRCVKYIDAYGVHRWYNRIEVEVVDNEQFYQLVVMLTEEEERRAPGSAAEDLPSAMSRLDQLGDRFHPAALKLVSSRTGSSTFAINNEYDVQTLMHALLATRFDDIRPEEWTPSYAGKSSRTDFLVKRDLVVVETKMMRDGLNDARLADELIIDTDR